MKTSVFGTLTPKLVYVPTSFQNLVQKPLNQFDQQNKLVESSLFIREINSIICYV